MSMCTWVDVGTQHLNTDPVSFKPLPEPNEELMVKIQSVARKLVEGREKDLDGMPIEPKKYTDMLNMATRAGLTPEEQALVVPHERRILFGNLKSKVSLARDVPKRPTSAKVSAARAKNVDKYEQLVQEKMSPAVPVYASPIVLQAAPPPRPHPPMRPPGHLAAIMRTCIGASHLRASPPRIYARARCSVHVVARSSTFWATARWWSPRWTCSRSPVWPSSRPPRARA